MTLCSYNPIVVKLDLCSATNLAFVCGPYTLYIYIIIYITTIFPAMLCSRFCRFAMFSMDSACVGHLTSRPLMATAFHEGDSVGSDISEPAVMRPGSAIGCERNVIWTPVSDPIYTDINQTENQLAKYVAISSTILAGQVKSVSSLNPFQLYIVAGL